MRTFILDITKEGKLKWSPTQTKIFLDWKNERKGKKIRMKVEDYKGTKSEQQLGYWFGALVPEFAHYHNISIDDAIDIMRREFNGKTIPLNGVAVKVGKSLAKNNHEQMEQAIERAVRWMTDNGLEVPDPEDFKREADSAPLK